MDRAGDSLVRMLAAFSLALGQLGDPRLLRVLAKSLVQTLLAVAAIGGGAWLAGDWALARAGLGEDMRSALALAAAIAGGWLLWRVVALAVLQLHGDEVVLAVEARHYPGAAATARKLGLREELGLGLRGAGRALAFNLLALPVALVLLVTGIGAPLVFWLVNAVLLGRELTELVALRHRSPGAGGLPLGGLERLVLGGIVAALLALPFVNFLAPLLGAAAATHLVHRKGPVRHAA